MSAAENPQGAPASAHKNKPRSRQPWWRAYNGLPTCARWRVVARRTRRPYVEVLGVVLCLLNDASASKVRGDIEDFNAETCAAGLDIETADVEAIVAALKATGWLVGGRIATWDDRQVAEEDSTAAERKAKQRERERAAKDQSVTACHGDVTADHDRGEERREDHSRLEQTDISKVEESDRVALRRRAGSFFERKVWPAYPQGAVFHQAQPARKKFIELILEGADPDEILAGVKRYGANPPANGFTRSPVQFLEDESWNSGEPLRERVWDANEADLLYLDCDLPPDELRRQAEIIVDGLWDADGKPRTPRSLPKDFGRPPVGYMLASDPYRERCDPQLAA